MIETMKAAVFTEYGAPTVLHIENVTKPSPKDNEILIKIHATAATSGDARLRRADPFAVRFFFGLFRPRKKILGEGFSGEVAAVGKDVRRFKVGDLVFGSAGMGLGTYAEFIVLPENGVLAPKPAHANHDAAAAVHFGGTTALHFLKKADVRPGQKVLIYGASGSVGSAAVQIAKFLGAEVTAVCSTANLELVKSIGADHVIDYTRDDFSKNGTVYDVIYETVNKAPVAKCAAALKPGGKLILGAALLSEMLHGTWATLTTGKKLIAGVALETQDLLDSLKKMMENGALQPVIDRVVPLEKIAEAHALIDSGRKKGNLVVRVA